MLLHTYSGKRINLASFSKEDVCIEDIAHALSNLCRFGGHTPHFYSVAQHSIRVASLVPFEVRLEGLLHDAAEAYLVDIPRPLKRLLPDYVDMEVAVSSAIYERFGVQPNEHSHLIQEMDTVVLAGEMRDLFGPKVAADYFPRVRILPKNEEWLTPLEAKRAFLTMFNQEVSHAEKRRDITRRDR